MQCEPSATMSTHYKPSPCERFAVVDGMMRPRAGYVGAVTATATGGSTMADAECNDRNARGR